MPYSFIACHEGNIVICYQEATDGQRNSKNLYNEIRENTKTRLKDKERACAQLWEQDGEKGFVLKTEKIFK
jgi:hypothetical protein